MARIIAALLLAWSAISASASEPLSLVDNPPDRHIVVKGDTLWGISGTNAPTYRFMKTKREAIAEVRWIYEGHR